MSYENISDFIGRLEQEGELKRIPSCVSRDLEITEITNRVSKAGGPALLFENVDGFDVPVLINAFGSMKRMALALGVSDVEEIARDIEKLVKFEPPKSLTEKLKALPLLRRVLKFPPKIVTHAPCQEVIEKDRPSLDKFPILRCWPEDGGRFITLPEVFTKSLDGRQRNVGMYRLHVYDEQTTGMHWHIHHDGARMLREYRETGKRMDVAVALGGDPAITYAASAPLPPGIDETLLAGFIRRKNVELVKCKTIDMEVPADAEIVLEGYVDPGELRMEGPFGDHTGYYCPADEYPVFHITCITHRKNPIYPTTIVGRPPMEDCYMGKATERIFLPLLQMNFPEIVDMNLPLFGVFHNFVLIAIDKSFPFHARKVMHGLWGFGQMMFSKIIIVVDKEVNVQDIDEVMWRVGNNIDPKRDTVFVEGPVDVLNHASPQLDFGSKMGIDATRKWPEEGFNRGWPDDIAMSDEIIKRVTERWAEYGLGDLLSE